MNTTHPVWPPDLLEAFNRDAAAAGYTSLRKDARNSRWAYMRKALALARQNREVLSNPL